MTPFVPPVATSELPALGGHLGELPEHFVVEEIPAYEPSGEGDHLYVWIEKRLENTKDVARQLARAAGVPERDIGFAGMKDRNAVTRQWFSLPARCRPSEEWQLSPSVSVKQLSRHKNKLRTGHLIGNRFELTVVDVPAGGLERARAIAAFLQRFGVGNYFGPQRFGRGGNNLGAAFAWLAEGSRPPRGTDEKLLSSVLQSEHFNRYCLRRLETRSRLIEGEVVRLNGSGAHFVVLDAEKEQPRLDAGDLCLTGPLLGPKGLQATSTARELELEIATACGLTDELLSRLGQFAPGSRRDLVLFPEGLAVDEPAEGHIRLSFSLPSGAYATQFVREFTRSPWDSPRAQG